MRIFVIGLISFLGDTLTVDAAESARIQCGRKRFSTLTAKGPCLRLKGWCAEAECYMAVKLGL